jgi:glycerate 2-kinase
LKPAERADHQVTITPGRGHAGAKRRAPVAVSDLLDALQAALKAANPEEIVTRNLSLRGGTLRAGTLTLELSRFERILVIGGGKASGRMAVGLEGVLGSRISAGVVNIPEYQTPKPKCERIVLHDATHPIPSPKGVEGVRMMLDLVKRPTAEDLVVCLISGGGSALMPLPAEGTTLDDIRRTTRLLLKSGAEIDEINTVRKHLSAFSGGRLVERLYPATVLSLIISDVVGDDLDAIASGPTVPDRTTYGDAALVLKKYGIWRTVPPRVRKTIEAGLAQKINETPKKGSHVFKRVHNLLVGSNRLSCLAAESWLRGRGYSTLVLSTRIRGEAREIGRLFAGVLADVVESGLPLSPPACIIAGGETTVTVRGDGLGGRNQELVLSAALAMGDLRGVYIASMGTDGVDGATKAAGALAPGGLVEDARRVGLAPGALLQNNDSNAFFQRMGGLIVTGPTGTNVNDMMIAMAVGKKSAGRDRTGRGKKRTRRRSDR